MADPKALSKILANAPHQFLADFQKYASGEDSEADGNKIRIDVEKTSY